MYRFAGIVAAVVLLGSVAAAPPLAEALSKVNLLDGLTAAERQAVAAAATMRQGKAGERIITQGKALGRMFVILAGEAEIRVNDKHLLDLDGQILVGEIEFLDGQPASADVVLRRDADLVQFDDAALTRVMDEHPRIGYVIMRRIARIAAERLRASNPK